MSTFWESSAAETCAEPGCDRGRWCGYRTCYRHTPVSRETLYRVWHAVTNDTHLSVRELARHTKRSTQTVQRALHQLQRIGALTHQAGQARAWTVLEPFNWVQWP